MKKIDLGLNGGGLGYGSLWAKKIALGSHFFHSGHARSTRGNYIHLSQTFPQCGWLTRVKLLDPDANLLTRMHTRAPGPPRPPLHARSCSPYSSRHLYLLEDRVAIRLFIILFLGRSKAGQPVQADRLGVVVCHRELQDTAGLRGGRRLLPWRR